MNRALEDLWRARMAWGLVLLLLVIHAWVEWQGGYQEVAVLYERGGLSRESVLAEYGAPLFTYSFLHASWFHLACNALLVLFLGARVESILGHQRLGVLLFLGAVFGGLFHLLLSGASTALLVGASGATMALLLMITTLSPESRMFPIPLAAGNVGLGVMIASFVLMLVNPDSSIPLLAGWGRTWADWWGEDLFRIGHACHFGGALAGWLMARWILRRPVSLEKLQAERERRES